MVSTETKVEKPNAEQSHLSTSTRLYEENFRYMLNLDLDYFPNTNRGTWEIHIFDTKEKDIVWKGTYRELIEKVLS